MPLYLFPDLRHASLHTTSLVAALAAIFAVPLAHADSYTASDFASLVQALNAANAADSRTTPHTITLTSDITVGGPLPLLFCNATLDGQGHTLNGDDQYRLLFVGVDGATAASLATQFPDSVLGTRIAVTLRDLTLAHGYAEGGTSLGSGGGGMGAGGALFVNGAADVTLQNVSFANNQAVGGNGGATAAGGGGGMGGLGGKDAGGGIYGTGVNGGGGLFGSGGAANTGATDPGGAGGGGYSGDGGDSNGNAPQAGTASIFGMTAGGGGGGSSDGMTGDPGAGNGGGGGGGTTLSGGGGGGFGGGSGADGDPANSIPGAGGDGGFGGGGGGSGAFGPLGGRGGFGGGGGYGGGGDDPSVVTGGFGGGGGFNGSGGFGGGGGAWGGNGGFGGGGGAEGAANGHGGFGGGDAGGSGIFNSGGGGGAGMGGAVFIVDGGTLTIGGDGALSGSGVIGGPQGGGSASGATAGQAFAAGVFLQGTTGTLHFAPAAGATFTLSDAIADEAGSDAAASSNARGISVSGDGNVIVQGSHSYTGTTAVGGATLELDGTLASSTLDITAGTLTGTGGMAALIAEGGSIAPGTTAQPYASLAVTGDATLQSGALLVVRADATSTASSGLTIGGAATLAGTVTVDFGGLVPAVGSRYPVLSAGSIAGTFSGVTLPEGVSGQLDYDATGVQLEITDQVTTDTIFADGFDGPAPGAH